MTLFGTIAENARVSPCMVQVLVDGEEWLTDQEADA